jgi:SAM-dependent methyltransferase
MSPNTDRVRSYFGRPEQYLSNRFEIDLRAEIVRELLGEPRAVRIVDVGCGDGSVSRQFLGDDCRIVMVDSSPQMLARCRQGIAADQQHLVRFHRLDLLSEEFPERFDVVLCLGVLAHVGSVERAVQRLAELCHSGGRCVIQFTDATRGVSRITRMFASLRRTLPGGHGYVTNRVTPAAVLAAARQSGLVPIDSRRYSLVLPGMRRLPTRWLTRYQRWTLRKPWLSRIGTEVIMLFQKPDAPLAGERSGDAYGIRE